MEGEEAEFCHIMDEFDVEVIVDNGISDIQRCFNAAALDFRLECVNSVYVKIGGLTNI